MKKLYAILEGFLLPICLLAVWEVCARMGWLSAVVLPAPSAVFAKWIESIMPATAYHLQQAPFFEWVMSGELIQDSISSMYRVLVGFAVGASLALPIGLLMGASPKIYRLCNPLLQILRPIPPIAYIPMAILWFGLGNPPSIFLIALGAFFPVIMNTIAGVRHVDGIYLRAARNLGASQLTMFRRVILPAATPYIAAGMRIGIGTAFIVVIVSELIAVNNGLGFRILEAREFLWSDKIIAGMITIGLLGLAIDIGMNAVNNHLLRWHRGLEQ